MIVGMSLVISASVIVIASAPTRAIAGTSATARIAIANVCAGGVDVNVSSASATSDIVIANTMAIVTKTAPDALSTPNTASPVTKSMTVPFAPSTVNTVSVNLNATVPYAPTTANGSTCDSPPTLVDLEYFLE